MFYGPELQIFRKCVSFLNRIKKQDKKQTNKTTPPQKKNKSTFQEQL